MTDKLKSQFKKINEIIGKSKKVLITSHENPDPDAVGSVLALSLILNKLGIKPLLYLSDPCPDSLSFLPDSFNIKDNIPKNTTFDILFALDYGDFKRLNLPSHILKKADLFDKIITIDHHQGKQEGKIKIVEPEISSTSEIIYQWIKKMPPKDDFEIDKDTATCLLTGIVADTGGFSHISTSFKTMEASSELLSKGGNLSKIINQVLFSKSAYSPGPLKSFAKVLSRIKFIPENKIVYSWLSFEDLKGKSSENFELDGICSVIGKEEKCDFALFLLEYEKGKVRGSLRSEPFKGIKVDAIAERLGGGGHPYAAGFKQEGSIGEVLKKVLDLIR